MKETRNREVHSPRNSYILLIYSSGERLEIQDAINFGCNPFDDDLLPLILFRFSRTAKDRPAGPGPSDPPDEGVVAVFLLIAAVAANRWLMIC